MLNFFDYMSLIVESKGADTAFSGHANEHFTHRLLKDYLSHLSNSVGKGVDSETAHNAAINHISNIKAKEHLDIPEIQNARKVMGDEEMGNIHNDSKKTAIAILNHLRNNYNTNLTGSTHVGKGGPKAVAELTGGKASEADLLLNTKNSAGKEDEAKAYLEHVGASLKYSKDKSNTIKIHSPTVNKMAEIIDNHHKAMHGKSSGIHETLDAIGREGLQAQQNSLAKHHNTLSNYFGKLVDKKMTYSPIVDKRGKVIGGNLSKEAISAIRDSKDPKLRAAYDDMATENLKMKNKIAGALHNTVSSILDHPSKKPEHAAVKESLLRGMGNLQKDKLPTFLVSTERAKPQASIYDVGHFFTNDIARNGTQRHNYTGKSTFNAGPMSFALDTRPTTSRNPITSFPINTTVKTSDIKANGAAPNTSMSAPVERPKKVSAASAPQRKKTAVPPTVASQNDIDTMMGEGGREPPERANHGGKSWLTPHEQNLIKSSR